jgi:peptidoglycan/LPS O-acetylase OafA/YrhL
MRIFPAFYFYLLVIAGFCVVHILPQDPKSFAASALYLWCYYPAAHGVFIQHSWSLSIEEQFYLLYPAALIFLHAKNKLVSFSMMLIALMPLIRVFIYFKFPGLRGSEYYLLYGWLDTMMVGCLLALVNDNDRFVKFKQRALTPMTVFFIALVWFIVNPILVSRLPKPFGGFYGMAIMPLTSALCIAATLIYLVDNSKGLTGRLLNMPLVRWVGMLSYSLYLWQQFFFQPEHFSFGSWAYLYVALAATASYFLIERPFLSLRGHLERKNKSTAVASVS